jgi:hypothetical protein
LTRREKKEIIALYAVVIVVLGGLLFGGFLNISENMAMHPQAKRDLQTDGYSITQEPINSTVNIVTTDDYSYFTQSIPVESILYEKNSYPSGFVAVFNTTHGLGYMPEYNSLAWWIW